MTSDPRHEATSRLAESCQYDLLELQAITGHRDIRMLQRYTHYCVTALAKKMGEILPPPVREHITAPQLSVIFSSPPNPLLHLTKYWKWR